MEVAGIMKKGEKNEKNFKFKDSSIVVDKILDCQRSPLNKTGLGYKKNKEKSEDDTWSLKTLEAGPSMSKAAPHAPAHDNKDFGSSKLQQGVRPIPQRKLRKETTQSPRYESGFNGYCYFCSNFGHKDMDCRFYGRRRDGSSHESVRCWKCNQLGHILATYHTWRCYTCSGFGHKSQ